MVRSRVQAYAALLKAQLFFLPRDCNLARLQARPMCRPVPVNPVPVTFVYCVETSKQLFSSSGSQTVLVFKRLTLL